MNDRTGGTRSGIWRALATAAVLIALAVLIYRDRQAFTALGGISFESVLFITAFTLAGWAGSAATYLIVLTSMNTRVRAREIFALHVAAGLLNHLPLRPGFALRAWYLKRRTGLSLPRFGGMYSVQSLAMGVSTGLAGVLAVSLAYGFEGRRARLLFTGFAVLLLAALVPLILPLRIRVRGRISRAVAAALEGRDQARRNPRTLLLLFLVGTLVPVAAGVRLFGGYTGTGAEVGIGASIVIGAAGMLSVIAAVTPGNLGVLELMTVGVGILAGVSSEQSLVAATLVRVVVTLCFLIVGLPSLWWLRGRVGHEPVGQAADG